MQNTELASTIRPRPVLAARHLLAPLPCRVPSGTSAPRKTSRRSRPSCVPSRPAIMARRSPSSMSEAYCSPFEYQILASTGARARTSWPSAGRDIARSDPARTSKLEPAAPIPILLVPSAFPASKSRRVVHLCPRLPASLLLCPFPAFPHAGGLAGLGRPLWSGPWGLPPRSGEVRIEAEACGSSASRVCHSDTLNL